MKTLISIFFILSYFIGFSQPTYTGYSISTPNNTSITASLLTGGELTQSQKNDYRDYWEDYYDDRITYLGEATWRYNCHAYAWHVSEGGNKVWINTPDDDEYWDDCSYTEVASQSSAIKVSFGGPCTYYSAEFGQTADWCDHSAITTNTTDEFISKWGKYPLFRHDVDDCPYDPQDLNYYVRASISGSYPVCSSNKTFTLNDKQSGKSVTWSKYNLTYVSGQSTDNYTVRAQSGITDLGWVKATIANDCPGKTTEIIKSGWVGEPEWHGLEVRDYYSKEKNPDLCLGDDNYLEVYSTYSSSQQIDEYGWNLTSGAYLYAPPPSPYDLAIITPFSSYVYFQYKAHNTCGWTSYRSNQLWAPQCGYFYSYTPNPVSDELSIEAEMAPNEMGIDNGSGFSAEFEAVLFNADQKKVKIGKSEGNKIKFNVSDLKKGSYFLHIIDMNEVKKEQVMIE